MNFVLSTPGSSKNTDWCIAPQDRREAQGRMLEAVLGGKRVRERVPQTIQ